MRENRTKKSKIIPRPSTANAWAIIKKWEGFKAEPYKCPAGVWTIGYGLTIYPDGQKVEERSPEITEAQASKFLVQYIQKYIEPRLTALVGDLVNQNQYDALVSFIYNVGMGAFEKSTMLQKIKAGDMAGAAAEFPRWNKAGGKVLAGLIARRKDEKALFERDPWVD